MAKYEPFGPFEVPRKNGIVDTTQIKKGSDLWNSIEECQKGLSIAHGCYIFSIRAGRGIRPWYVGQAKGKNGFLQEILSDNKLKEVGVLSEHYYRTRRLITIVVIASLILIAVR